MTSRGKKILAMITTNQKSKSDIDNNEFNKTDEQTKNTNDNKQNKTYNGTNCDNINVIEPTESTKKIKFDIENLPVVMLDGQNELENSKEDNEENNLVSLCFDSLLEDNATVSLEEESYMYELDENGVLINQTLLNPLEISINSELEQSTNNLERSEVMNDLLDNNETGSESVRSSSLEKNDGVVEQNYQSTYDNEKDNDSDYQPESEINNNSSDSEDSEMIDRTENANLDAEIGNQEENNKARKRRLVANSEEWKRNKNKKLRLEGKPYLGFSKKKGEKMKQDTQRVERRLKETCKSTKCKKRDKRLQVCRQMFIKTLDLGYKTIQDWVSKGTFGMGSESSRNTNYNKDKYANQYKNLNTFFEQLPKLPAHYCRKDTSKLYLEQSFQTFTDLYKAYTDYCTEVDTGQPLNRKIFRKAFKEKNLSIFSPKKDQCNTCFSYKYNNIEESKWKTHIENKNKAREEKIKDKKLAEEGKCIVLTMDLQAVKLSPYVPAGKLYFKTKLCCHNFTIYDLATRDVTCYWFSEDQNSDLCASTFTTCIIDHLESKCITESKVPIIIYSDGCGFQNRNKMLANALLNLAMKHEVTIYQKYLEPGHTQMECDSVHSLIERKLKNREIHLPSDYCSVSRECRVTPRPYDVKLLEFNFFKNYAETKHLRYTSLRPGKRAYEPGINDIRCIRYTALPTPEITVKLSYEEPYISLPVRPKSIPVIDSYPPLLSAPSKIKKSKWEHLQELKSVLPKDTHAFYDNILYTK
ncbi:unnamed protein product [Ceutorhynchus assimilis]|uniref:Uncharacterized protein n=1 Tax=Ceutorhynchus assimilis TaxID=467358 RepID=A0A9N9QNX2_9CUCU|nr:unnamed protein product [Ceutorhynchus assimilis]